MKKKPNLGKWTIPMLGFGLLTSCGDRPQTPKSIETGPDDVTASVNLTVAEGKRLIAKGLVRYAPVREKLHSGMIVITRGTTNTYIAEELAGLDAQRGSFMTGNITPVTTGNATPGLELLSEIVLVDGRRVDMPYIDALKQMKEGDVIFKGGNMLNYEKRQATVCVGAPDGGTVARLTPYVGPGKARLIIPIGLEKEVSSDLSVYADVLARGLRKLDNHPKVHFYNEGDIFTEIEAIRQFADVQVFPYASGGIAGREGGISLIVCGSEAEVRKALEAVASVQGEPPFID